MKFLSIHTPDQRTAGSPPSPELMADMGRFVEEMLEAGVLLATGGLLPGAHSVRLRASGGTVAVTNGPFTGTTGAIGAIGAIGGFALIEVRSQADAIEVCRRFLLLAGGGVSELHQVMDAPPPDLPS